MHSLKPKQLLFLLTRFPCLQRNPNNRCSSYQDFHAFIGTQQVVVFLLRGLPCWPLGLSHCSSCRWLNHWLHQSTVNGLRAMRSCAVGVSLPFHNWLQIACMADGVLRVPYLLGGGTSSQRDSVSKGGWSMLIALPSKSASGGSIPLYWCKSCVGE